MIESHCRHMLLQKLGMSWRIFGSEDQQRSGRLLGRWGHIVWSSYQQRYFDRLDISRHKYRKMNLRRGWALQHKSPHKHGRLDRQNLGTGRHLGIFSWNSNQRYHWDIWAHICSWHSLHRSYWIMGTRLHTLWSNRPHTIPKDTFEHKFWNLLSCLHNSRTDRQSHIFEMLGQHK